MKQRIKTKWLKALRDGKYKQAKFALNNGNNCFCVLGVLCDLYAKETKTEWDRSTNLTPSIHGCDISLPDKVIEWAGLEEPNPRVVYKGEYVGLMRLNDSLRMSFKQIARVIEHRL